MNYDAEIPPGGFVSAVWVKRRYAISNSTMYEWIADKHLPSPIKIGPRAVRFRVEDIQRFEEGLLIRNAEAAG